MADFVGSIALIRDLSSHATRWLLQKDTSHHRFIQTARLEGESFRTALIREVAWQLKLDQKKDFIISSVPRLHYQSPMQSVPSDELASMKTCDINPEESIEWVITQFFIVDLYGKNSRSQIENDISFQWWSTSEVLSGKHANGTVINPRQHQLIKLTEVISAVDG